MSTPDSTRHTEHERGAIAAQISREIVQLHANHYGRGPTKAKTHVNDTYVLCLLEDVFTPAERTLVDAGKAEQVHATRAAFQEAVSEEFTTIVERASGQAVRAFMSMVHVEPELAVELFLLEPAAGPGLEAVPEGAVE
jgi:uncharacterized protein YbcI